MKRFLSVLLLVLIVVLLTSVCASAKVVYSYGDWTLQNALQNNNLFAVDSYCGTDSDVTVPDTYGGYRIVEICSFAFMNDTQIKSLTSNQYLLTICHDAFINATGLQRIKLNPFVGEIGSSAFYGTENLKEINLEDTRIKKISSDSFSRSGIESITLPETCITIEDNAFAFCSSLGLITIPASVTEISVSAFTGCENLVICAPYGSYAIEYAVAHEIPYEYSNLTKVTFIRGDADGDGSINIMDATKIQRVLAKYEEDNDGMIALRSRLGDEDFGIMDATRIQRFLARYTDPYRISEEETVFLMPDGTIFSSAA